MKNIEEIKKKLAAHRSELRERYNVRTISIFGSYARGDQTEKSDLDVLVELNKTVGIFQLIDLQDHIRKLVGLKVDLVPKESLKPVIKDEILREAVSV